MELYIYLRWIALSDQKQQHSLLKKICTIELNYFGNNGKKNEDDISGNYQWNYIK